MITADEAYKLSIESLEFVQTIDQLLEAEQAIKQAIERKVFACITKPMPLYIAEKLAIELEEFGYQTNVQGTNMINQDGNTLAAVCIIWRFLPSPLSRVPKQVCN